MSKKTVAELLVETLAGAGVKRIYGVAGDSLNGITDAIRKRDDIQWIHVRHEETAAFAAGADAHLSGRLAVCAGSCGPGNLHLINGLYGPIKQTYQNRNNVSMKQLNLQRLCKYKPPILPCSDTVISYRGR